MEIAEVIIRIVSSTIGIAAALLALLYTVEYIYKLSK